MARRKIRNQVIIAGRIAYIWHGDNISTIVVDTGVGKNGHRNKPCTIAFEKVLDVARHYKVGDHVILEATMQENKKATESLPRRTIAVNHIARLDPDHPRYHTQNYFELDGWVVAAEKHRRSIRARIKVNANGLQNFLTIHLKIKDVDKFNEFCNISRDERIRLWGYIKTGKEVKNGKARYFDKLIVTDYFRPNVKRTTS